MPMIDVLKSYLSNPGYIIKNYNYRKDPTPSKGEYIFVIGAPRSGTTLLQSVLSANEKITSFDEETGFFMYRDLFKNRFQEIKDDVYDNFISKSDDIVSLFDCVANYKTAEIDSIFLEKTPQHVFLLNKLVKWFPNSKFIHIHRDIRDSIISAKNFSGIAQGSTANGFLNYWNKSIDARYLANSRNVYDVAYENLVNNPNSEVFKIMNFLNIDYNVNQIDPNYFSKNSRAGSEGFNKLVKPIDNKSVGVWRTSLSKDEVRRIEGMCEHNLKRLGYI